MALTAEETPQAPPRPSRKVVLLGIALGLIAAVAFWARRDSTADDLRIVPHRFVIPPEERGELLHPDRLQEAIERGTRYLVASCHEDGRFDYCRDLNRPRYQSTSYNVLRHAGAIYALCQRHAWKPSQEVSVVVGRAVKFLQRETFQRLPGVYPRYSRIKWNRRLQRLRKRGQRKKKLKRNARRLHVKPQKIRKNFRFFQLLSILRFQLLKPLPSMVTRRSG